MSLTQQPPPSVPGREPLRPFHVVTEEHWFEGDVVECYVDVETKERGRFLVTKENPTNIRLEDENGNPKVINRRGILGKSEDQTWTRRNVPLPRGTVVRFVDDRGQDDRRGEFFVLKSTRDARHEVIAVGGADATWRDVSGSGLEVVTGPITVPER